MRDRDWLLRDLLKSFFEDLLQIVAPELAPKLRSDNPKFIHSWLYRGSSFPERKPHYPEFVARVDSLEGGPEDVYFPVEIQPRPQGSEELGLIDYVSELWLGREASVVPIVLYLQGGKPDITREEARALSFGQSFLSFTYLAFGLSESDGAAYLARPEPLAWALAALMKRGEVSAEQHRLACLSRIRAAELAEGPESRLVECVEAFLPSVEVAQEEDEARVAERRKEDLATLEFTWAGRIRQEGLEEGVQKGIDEGKRDLLLEQIEHRFGSLPEEMVKRLRALTSPEELSRLAARVLDAPSLEDLGL
jgi:hypothetical protein